MSFFSSLDKHDKWSLIGMLIGLIMALAICIIGEYLFG
jgi:uncharacterized membrane protein